MVVSLHHPFGPPLPGEQGGYFDTELVSDTWQKGGVTVTQHFWKRPLSADVDEFADAGFVIERVVEPQPSGRSSRAVPRGPGPGGRRPLVHRLPTPAHRPGVTHSPRARQSPHAGAWCRSANRAASVANPLISRPTTTDHEAPGAGDLLVERRRPRDHGAGPVGRAGDVGPVVADREPLQDGVPQMVGRLVGDHLLGGADAEAGEAPQGADPVGHRRAVPDQLAPVEERPLLPPVGLTDEGPDLLHRCRRPGPGLGGPPPPRSRRPGSGRAPVIPRRGPSAPRAPADRGRP
jgi:hypothetical protein